MSTNKVVARPVSRKVERERRLKTAKPQVKAPPCECGKPHYARGMCGYHYRQALVRGDFVTARCKMHCGRNASGASPFCRRCGNEPLHLDLPRRFWDMVVVVDDVPTDQPCWIWRGVRSFDGLPASFSYFGASVSPARLVVDQVRPISDTDVVIHSCQLGCVNPAHIDDGSAIDAARTREYVNPTGVHGVYAIKSGYLARVRGQRMPDGSYPSVNLGIFTTLEDAATAVDEYQSQRLAHPTSRRRINKLAQEYDNALRRVRAERQAVLEAIANLRRAKECAKDARARLMNVVPVTHVDA